MRECDIVRVCTKGEAASLRKSAPGVSWIGLSGGDVEDKNDIVILRNYEAVATDEETWDDEKFLLEDGRHTHG